ncbi:MAG: hypothetical protein HGB19_10795, partial [Chlorobiales bacterium]|nr:hypothetical protein [Chlorobiales bacterium]
MIPTNKEYPVFEANQVLTATHLNTLQDYLDEQNRLTRAALHGIGVVCGLEVSVVKKGGTTATLTISKGYGVTSEGYLGIVGNQDFVADRYREFTVEDGYSLLSKDHKNKYPLWELLDADHDDYSDGNTLTSSDLAGKVVLLFVELLEKDLKNCSATSCDDMGLKVQVNIRKLLISEIDLKKLHEEIAKNTEDEKANGDFFPDLTARLGLPDLKLPRLDVPASNMVDGASIFDAYREILSPPANILLPESAKSLFKTAGEALDMCYDAFKPMLPALNWKFSDKLKDIEKVYNDRRIDTTVIFSQYFYDFLSDLIEAYEEFRWKALEFMALCNPPQTLFPRHLELGETGDGNFAGQKVHRHYFRPSPALSEGKKAGEEVQQLFQRLRFLVEQFKAPAMPEKGSLDTSLKITPSRLGDVALSDKAIPYYYTFSQALLNTWNFTKTRTGRAGQNNGYYVPGGGSVLLSDLERYNFFRIEGHLGFDWRETVKNLLDKIRKYRLPFDVVALNAHPSTATTDVLSDPLISHCLTNDLEVIYGAWTKELECLMKDKIKALTDFKFRRTKGRARSVVTPSVSMIEAKADRKINIADAIVTVDGTFGKVLADVLKNAPGASTLKLKEAFKASLLKEVPEVSQLPVSEYDLAIGQRLDTVAAMIELSNALPDAASDLQYSAVSDKYKNLSDIMEKYRDDLSAYKPSGEKPVLTDAQREALLKEIEDILKNCLMARLKELGAELERRKKEVDELIFFSKYIQKHPGITHKAGVSAGGTFILIFQETPAKAIPIETKKASEYKVPERVVISDFFLPYRCCSDCPPVQFVVPAARPIFSMKQECPDEKGFAWVALEFTYRMPPCEVKIDEKDYVPLVDDRIKLKIGPHVVIVRDAEGGVSLAQSIEVFPHFSVEAEKPVCDEENKIYTVKIKVSNPRLPITLDGKEAAEKEEGANIYSVLAGPYKSGE